MPRKTELSPAPTGATIDQQTGDLLAELDGLRRALRKKILTETDTAPIRARITAIEERVKELRAAAKEAQDEAERAGAERIAEMAAIIAKTAKQNIEDRLLLLQPPSKPTK